MLTGDKVETAKCIANSTGIVPSDQQIIEILSKNPRQIISQLNSYSNIQDKYIIITGDQLE